MRVLLCPLSDRGYLYPAIGVGRELSARGHDVHAIARVTAAPALRLAGLPLLPVEELGGQGALNASHWADHVPAQYAAVRHAARQLRPDVLVTSALCLGSLIAAEVLDLPVVVLGFATHIWNYQSGPDTATASPLGIPAGRAGISREMLRLYDEAREHIGLAPRSTRGDHEPYLGTVTLLRGHPELEEPGAVLPDRVHHVGPCAWEPPAEPGWVAELEKQLGRVGKPVVYVHLGRTFGGVSLWERLNAMFTNGAFQAIVEQGRSTQPSPDPKADLLLVRIPWMGPLIERSELVLTNGTSAPVLNALLRGRPLGVSPNGSEQPLLAQACIRAGVAVRIRPDVPSRPAEILHDVRGNRQLRQRATSIGRELAAQGGSTRAADFVEDVAGSGRLLGGHPPERRVLLP